MIELYNSDVEQQIAPIEAARAAKEAARAAWVAAGSPRGDHPLFVAACAATKALAAAEQAAPTPAQGAAAASAGIDAVLARQVATAKADAKVMALARAKERYWDAQEWPRCGQDWPAGAAEEAADRLLRASGFDVGGA